MTVTTLSVHWTLSMDELLCQIQYPVQIATAATLTLLTGVFSAFILSATTVRYIKKVWERIEKEKSKCESK